jgi:hypothetical protein
MPSYLQEIGASLIAKFNSFAARIVSDSIEKSFPFNTCVIDWIAFLLSARKPDCESVTVPDIPVMMSSTALPQPFFQKG